MTAHTLLAVLILVSVSSGKEPPKTGAGNYIIFFITTDLQRELFGKQARNYVLVNGNALFRKDGSMKPNAINLEDFSRALCNGAFAPDPEVNMTVAFNQAPSENSKALIRFALIGVAHRTFKKIQVVTFLDDRDQWKTALAFIKDYGSPNQEEVLEPDAGAGLVKVYPVLTSLSRFITDDADCVVYVGDQHGKSPASIVIAQQERRIAKAIAQLKLVRKERLRFTYGERPREPEERRKFDVANKELAKKLGFKHHSVVAY